MLKMEMMISNLVVAMQNIQIAEYHFYECICVPLSTESDKAIEESSKQHSREMYDLIKKADRKVCHLGAFLITHNEKKTTKRCG